MVKVNLKLLQKHLQTLRFESRSEGVLGKQTGMVDITVSEEEANAFEEGKNYSMEITPVDEAKAEATDNDAD